MKRGGAGGGMSRMSTARRIKVEGVAMFVVTG